MADVPAIAELKRWSLVMCTELERLRAENALLRNACEDAYSTHHVNCAYHDSALCDCILRLLLPAGTCATCGGSGTLDVPVSWGNPHTTLKPCPECER